MSGAGAAAVVRATLDAIEARDLGALEALLTEDASWQNVPHPPASGRSAVLELLGAILTWSDEVRWDVVSAAYQDGRAWVERVDRFWIDGEEHAVACNGVFDVDLERGALRSVRDYVDLGEWRGRLGPALQRRSAWPAARVIERHLDAVRRRDLVAMAADYAADAVLVRAGAEYEGRRAISDYFRTVPARLGAATLELAPPDQALAVKWRIVDGTTVAASGTDTYTVDQGRITRQVVALDGTDF